MCARVVEVILKLLRSMNVLHEAVVEAKKYKLLFLWFVGFFPLCLFC